MAAKRDEPKSNSLEAGDQGDDSIWLTTYGDVMSLILVFFVMLFAISNIDKNKFQAIASSLAIALGGKNVIGERGYVGQSPLHDKSGIGENIAVDSESAKVEAELESLSKLAGDIKRLIKEEGMQEGVEVALDHRGVVLYAAGSAFFKSGEIEILDEAKPFLQKAMSLLKGVEYKILVEGHTDDVPIHNLKFASNWELSTGRATNVVRYFIEKGAIAPERLSAAGYAEFKPRYPHSPDNRAKNRRVEIIILREKSSKESSHRADTGQRAPSTAVFF